MKKKILLATLLLVINTIVYAMPAHPLPIVVTQPDGTQITIRIHGDEHFNYTTSEDGYLIKRAEDGFFKFATLDKKGIITPTSFVCRPIEQRTNSEKLYLQNVASKENYKELIPEVWNSNISRRLSPARSNSPMRMGGYVGGTKYLVILVGYSDLPFTQSRENFDEMLNQNGYNVRGAVGSAKDYFTFSSDGQFVPTFDVHGPYTMPNTMAYYGRDDSRGEDGRVSELIVEACRKVAADGVNLSQYDTNRDGYIDNVCVFYAGYGTAEGGSNDAIWPHYYQVYPVQDVGSVKVRDYVVMPEFRGYCGSIMTGIGPFCHEFSHFLGLPDFYKTDGSSDPSTLHDWDLMDGGCYNGPGGRGDVPCGYSTYERFFMGWLRPELLSDNGNYNVSPLGNSASKAYLIPQTSNATHNLDGKNPNPTNFYLIENRKQSEFDTYLPASGMLIWQVLYNYNNWAYNRPNNNTPYGMYIMAADGNLNSSTQSNDAFPLSNVTSHKLTSTTDSKWNKVVENITRRGDDVSFSIVGNSVGSDSFLLSIADNRNWIVKATKSGNGNYSAIVYNVLGQPIYSQQFTKEVELSTSSLNTGAYFVVVEDFDAANGSKERFTSLPVIK